MFVESLLFEIIFVLFIVLLNAFFVAAEFSIVKVRSTQLDTLAKKDNQRAKIAKKVVSNLDKYLSATQLGVTISSLALGWIGEPISANLLKPVFALLNITNPQTIHTLALTFGFVVITYLHVILGELAPKYIAIKYAKRVALTLAVPLNIFYLVFKPFIWVLNVSSRFIVRILGIQSVTDVERFHSEEELRLLIAEGRQSGAIDQTEHQLIEKIFEFNDKQAQEIMVPRNRMVALNIEDSREEIYRVVTEEGFSRLPVYNDTTDNIIGVIYTKDLISAAEHRELITLQDIIRPAYFVSSTKQIGNLLKEMQRHRVHMAIVVDEYGGVEGLITIEDIIEEIVGEIQDEYDEEKPIVEKINDREFVVNALASIYDVNTHLPHDLPEDGDFDTVSGWLGEIFGKIPDVGEQKESNGYNITVLKKSDQNIESVKLELLINEEDAVDLH